MYDYFIFTFTSGYDSAKIIEIGHDLTELNNEVQ